MAKEKNKNDLINDAIEYHQELTRILGKINKMELSLSLEEHVSKEKSKEMFNRIRNESKKK